MTAKQRTAVRGKPWKKGQSGNPKGRAPVGKTLAEAVRMVGEENDEETGRTRLQAVIRRLFKDAKLKGGERAAALLFERGFGKVTQTIEIPRPLPVRFEDIDYRDVVADSPAGPEEDSPAPG